MKKIAKICIAAVLSSAIILFVTSCGDKKTKTTSNYDVNAILSELSEDTNSSETEVEEEKKDSSIDLSATLDSVKEGLSNLKDNINANEDVQAAKKALKDLGDDIKNSEAVQKAKEGIESTKDAATKLIKDTGIDKKAKEATKSVTDKAGKLLNKLF